MRLDRHICIALLIAALALWAGIALRQWVWKTTQPIHFTHDVNNGFFWGTRALRAGVGDQSPPLPLKRYDHVSPGEFVRGYLGLYEQRVAETVNGQFGKLNYTPLRLLIMSTWAWHVHAHYPDAAIHADKTDRYAKPLLRLNRLCEIASALLMFLLARHWLARGTAVDDRSRGPLWRPMVAALLLWFNPALIMDAHIWPQWDVWNAPFFLGAALLASHRNWTWAGAMLGIGAMLKGQLLLVTPLFFLWPAFNRRWADAGRCLLGCATSITLIVLPWLMRSPAAVAFVAVCVLLTAALTRRTAAALAAFVIAAFICVPLFDGSMAWYRVGLEHPTRHFNRLAQGSTANLPHVLSSYGWQISDRIVAGVPITMKSALVAAYAVVLIICAWAVARLAARNDKRVLLAMVAPWILFFALLPQMRIRYLLWGSMFSALGVAVGWRALALHLLLTALTAGMIGWRLLEPNPAFCPEAWGFVDAAFPEAWPLVLAAAAVWLALICWPAKAKPPAGYELACSSSRAHS